MISDIDTIQSLFERMADSYTGKLERLSTHKFRATSVDGNVSDFSLELINNNKLVFVMINNRACVSSLSPSSVLSLIYLDE